MATNQDKSPLFVVGTPVVVTGDGRRLSLSGELSDEQREQLGDVKVASLQQAGHLQTKEQLDEADRIRRHLDDQRGRVGAGGFINPNYGTPSMTPEAAEKFGAPNLAQGARHDERALGETAQSRTPSGWEGTSIDQLDLDVRTANALTAAGLKTAGDVVRYGDKNDGLQSIEGIGEASEESIQKALKKIAK